jgi:UDP-glucose 4-epimerase
MSKILVTGGCGYIGSHTIVDLLDNQFSPISADSHIRSSSSILDAVAQITGTSVKNYAIDLCDAARTRQLFDENPDIEGIIHFAALKSVPESVANPLQYYQNNLNSLLLTLENAVRTGVKNFIFSSSCSVYGNADELPVTEQTPLLAAESPYAATKQICEQILRDTAKAYPRLRVVLLRYFNPAGAHESNLLGEIPQAGAQNMVPLLTETAAGLRAKFTIHGGDYSTRDGSCIRDYIHVMDLAHAHTLCLRYLQKQTDTAAFCEVFNVGIGQGVSVLEAVQALENIAQKSVPHTIGSRRAGDVVAIYANYDKAARLLGWQPKYSLHDIMRTAWAWQNRSSNKKN